MKVRKVRISFREACTVYLAKKYGKRVKEAEEIIRRYQLMDQDIDRIVGFFDGDSSIRVVSF